MTKCGKVQGGEYSSESLYSPQATHSKPLLFIDLTPCMNGNEMRMLWNRIIEIIRGGFNLIYNNGPLRLSLRCSLLMNQTKGFHWHLLMSSVENILKLKICVISYHCPKFNKNMNECAFFALPIHFHSSFWVSFIHILNILPHYRSSSALYSQSCQEFLLPCCFHIEKQKWSQLWTLLHILRVSVPPDISTMDVTVKC